MVLRLLIPSGFITLMLLLSGNASAKRIVISIDGTDNAPSDGFDDYSLDGELKDESISNVFKMHLFAGGSFPNPCSSPIPDPCNADGANGEQISLYFIGVGNPDQFSPWKIFSRLGAKQQSLFALHDPEKIKGIVIEQLRAFYAPGDTLYLFGFSRGAAIARQLAQELLKNGFDMGGVENVKPPIRFMGLWDTVAAIGLPDSDEPSGKFFGEEGSVHRKVEEVVHLLAMDEMRVLFRPTLIGARDRVTEMWFPGVHSDIGGGYRIDGLSDITLQYMIDRAKGAGLHIDELEDAEATLAEIGITVERLKIEPDANSDMHGPSSWKPSNLLESREIRVESRQSEPALPIVHSAMLERRNGPKDYEPQNIIDSNITIHCALAAKLKELCSN